MTTSTTISLDLRFAGLPGGGFVYAAKLAPALVTLYPQCHWRLYYNPQCSAQQDIIQRNRFTDLSHVELRPVKAPCLSLKQHLDFSFIRDDAALYHYLHFDMPLGMNRLPLVITIHDLYPLTVPGYCSPLKRTYFLHLLRHNVRRAAAVIAISQFTKQDILKYCSIPPEKITVIPQSHSHHFHPITDSALLADTIRDYKLPPHFILYTGNHKPHKNLTRLIQAYAQLPLSLQRQFPLLLTGRIDTPAQQLILLAQQLNCADYVRFLGWVEEADLPPLYNLADLVVLPSLYEGFGLAPLEAFAVGTAAACSNATAIPEVVGSLARQFNPTDIDDITHAIQIALENDLADPAAQQARIAHAQHFSEKKTAQSTYAVYQSIIANGS